jgi:hypothetical protein
MPYNKLFISLACLVFTEKYRTLVFLYKPRPTDSVCAKKTSVRYFSVEISRSVNKKLIVRPIMLFSSVTWSIWQSSKRFRSYLKLRHWRPHRRRLLDILTCFTTLIFETKDFTASFASTHAQIWNVNISNCKYFILVLTI